MHGSWACSAIVLKTVESYALIGVLRTVIVTDWFMDRNQISSQLFVRP